MKLVELAGLALENNLSTKHAWQQAISSRLLQNVNQDDIDMGVTLTCRPVDFGGRGAMRDPQYKVF